MPHWICPPSYLEDGRYAIGCLSVHKAKQDSGTQGKAPQCDSNRGRRHCSQHSSSSSTAAWIMETWYPSSSQVDEVSDCPMIPLEEDFPLLSLISVASRHHAFLECMEFSFFGLLFHLNHLSHASLHPALEPSAEVIASVRRGESCRTKWL